MEGLTTFGEHVLSEESISKSVRDDYSHFLPDFLLAVKDIHNKITRAGLVDILGNTDLTNVHGEEVKKLDIYAHEVVVTALKRSGWVYAMASEEEEKVIAGSDGEDANYIVVFDPLDGSSNVDVNVSVGTIFSIYKRKEGSLEDQVLRDGEEQIMSGYVLYGSSTMLVYTVGAGAHGFTFDPAMGQFFLSHEDMSTPEEGEVFSINEGNAATFDAPTRRYLEEIKAAHTHTGRYIGSLVADVHRNLLRGGVYLYPFVPKPKLRLLYEGFPIGWLVEQAGGLATTGTERILSLQAKDLHERVSLIIGSRKDVERYEELVKESTHDTV